MDLMICQLWGVPSKKLSLEKVNEIAVEAGKEYTLTPGVAPGSNCPHDEFWLPQMSSLMVIASLQEDDAELTRCSNWFKVEEYSYGEEDDVAFQTILYHVANIFRDRKFRSFAKLEKFLELCRVKVPPLLMSALESIRSGNSKKTSETLLAAALDHAKKTNTRLSQGQLLHPHDIVALYLSLLWNVAEHRRLKPPTIPPEVRPFLLTRQTLGFPPIQSAKTSIAPKSKTSEPSKSKTSKGSKPKTSEGSKRKS
jgi:hypothetical protein